MIVIASEKPKEISSRSRRAGWFCFVLVIAIAFVIERRAPSFSGFYSNPLFQNWTRTIGELAHVSPANPIWLRWTGYLLLVTPFLIWISVTKTGHKSKETIPPFVLVLLVATYALTIWQARWGYFFVLIFTLALPRLLEPIKSPAAVWIAFFLSIFPILRDWDERLWPNEAQLAERVERRDESAQLWDLALSLRSPEIPRSLRRGGFHQRSPIGRISPAWLAVRMRVCRELKTVRVFLSAKIGERPVNFWKITRSLG
jgi:hypothetical protein